mmetsp:Transcript_41323/g.81240  ORF Transcript_41323/g.81240 Transcript_41323/m.81240 type:complete len:201 (+) Transcript_41323:298-900(+)
MGCSLLSRSILFQGQLPRTCLPSSYSCRVEHRLTASTQKIPLFSAAAPPPPPPPADVGLVRRCQAHCLHALFAFRRSTNPQESPRRHPQQRHKHAAPALIELPPPLPPPPLLLLLPLPLGRQLRPPPPLHHPECPLKPRHFFSPLSPPLREIFHPHLDLFSGLVASHQMYCYRHHYYRKQQSLTPEPLCWTNPPPPKSDH